MQVPTCYQGHALSGIIHHPSSLQVSARPLDKLHSLGRGLGMKTRRTLLLIALLAACNVMAQEQQAEQQNTVSSAATTTSVGKLNFHWLAPDQQADVQNDREPVEGLSPQAWTTIVGWHPGRSAFPDDETSTTEMPLLWFGHEPWE
jgi:hypothetical protein